MLKGHKLSGTSSNQSQPRTSPSPSGCISSDSQAAVLHLTVENVKKLEKEYLTAKGVLSNQSVEEYVEQSNRCLLERGRSGEFSREHVLDKNNLVGTIASLPRELDKKSRESHLESAQAMSPKGSLLTEFQTDSLSTPHVGSKSKESKKSIVESSTSHRRQHEVEDLGTQTEWSYSNKSLASVENAISIIREEKRSGEDVDGKENPEPILSQDIMVLFTDIDEESESEEGSEENKQIKSDDQVVSAESDAAVGEDKKSEDEEEEGHDDLKITTLFLDVENHFAETGDNCEFCNTVVRPIPTVEALDTEPLETLLCCRTYKEVFECVIRELLESTSSKEEIDIAPHPHLSRSVLESETRKKLEQHFREGSFDKHRELYERFLNYGAVTKISFKFSEPQEEATPVGPELPQTPESLDAEFRAEHLKNCHVLGPVRRYYPDGQKFYLLFPDGTGQVWYPAKSYPSGNIAILILYVKKAQFIYIILEDQTYSGIRAFFTNYGYATCYHKNGLIWLSVNLHSGSYFDKKGRQQKHWSWHDFTQHVHAPPFQPICMKLNFYIRIKIVAQDQIYLSFTKQHDCIHFNMGSRLKLKKPATVHLLKSAESQPELLLHSKTIEIHSLLAKMQKALRDLKGSSLNNMQALPLVLAQLRKLLKWGRRKAPVP